jgi:hypothetical protein
MANEEPGFEDKELNAEKPEVEESGLRSSIGRWLRRIILLLLVFVFLVAVAWFALIGPKAAEISKLQTDLVTSQQQVATLEAQVDDQQTLKAQRSILSLLVDANVARFELANGEKAAAGAALLSTGNTLYQLDLELGDEYDETIASLITRLSLVREGIQSENDISSLNDLEVFVDMLTNLLQSLLSQ